MSDSYIWQDREIRFDSAPKSLNNRSGEYIIDSINSVEDTKGNNGERGSIIVTNLRMMWVAHKNTRTNLSIGFNTVLTINVRKAKSKLRGQTAALFIMTKYMSNRFEFIFTSLVKQSPRLFTTIQSVHRAYETSRLYRDLKLRGSIIRDNQLVLLPMEQVYNQVQDVWNLSSDQGNVGCFFITNVRIVWHANLAQNFNVSVPYMQMVSAKSKMSGKFGQALVIETQPKCGGYILGFRVHPPERLDALLKEILSLHKIFSVNPVFGVDFKEEEVQPDIDQLKIARVEDDVEIVDTDTHDAFAAYYADGADGNEKDIVYDNEIGLACEQLPDGWSMSNLWSMDSTK